MMTHIWDDDEEGDEDDGVDNEGDDIREEYKRN